jgi:hypothetical protein
MAPMIRMIFTMEGAPTGGQISDAEELIRVVTV